MLRISPCPHLCPEGGPPWAGFVLGGNEITDWVGSTVRHLLGRILLNGAPRPSTLRQLAVTRWPLTGLAGLWGPGWVS